MIIVTYFTLRTLPIPGLVSLGNSNFILTRTKCVNIIVEDTFTSLKLLLIISLLKLCWTGLESREYGRRNPSR
jgi:hypothetical protein